LDVAQHIAQLAVAHVSPEEQAGVIKHEKDMNILKILDHYSIYELIRIENDDSSEKERKVLESEELKKEYYSNRNIWELTALNPSLLSSGKRKNLQRI